MTEQQGLVVLGYCVLAAVGVACILGWVHEIVAELRRQRDADHRRK